MTNDILTLLQPTYEIDEYGREVATYQEATVFCRVDSVSRSEWFESGRNGINPEYRFTVFAGDYNGEDTILYQDNRYGVYRTYQDGDYMELYVERKEGA